MSNPVNATPLAASLMLAIGAHACFYAAAASTLLLSLVQESAIDEPAH